MPILHPFSCSCSILLWDRLCKRVCYQLIIGTLGSFITNVYLSRWLLGLFVNSGYFDKRPGWFGVKKSAIHDLKENVDTLDLTTKFDRFDFMKHRKKFFAFSDCFTCDWDYRFIVFKLNLAIDFTNGTRVEILANEPLTTEMVAD